MKNPTKDEGLSLIIDLDVPEKSVSKEEIKLIRSHLRELMLKLLMMGEEKK